MVARTGGRRLLDRWGPVRRRTEKVLPRTEAIMAKHGGKTVFFGRFVAILRFTAAWVAGLSRMEWKKFLFWNAAGGICWATLVGLVAYYLGDAAAAAIQKYLVFMIFLLLQMTEKVHPSQGWRLEGCDNRSP
jgi:membrane protein DedA with SNARE-associated domain